MNVKLKKALRWAVSKDGLHSLGAAAGAITAVYTALHKLGVL